MAFRTRLQSDVRDDTAAASLEHVSASEQDLPGLLTANLNILHKVAGFSKTPPRRLYHIILHLPTRVLCLTVFLLSCAHHHRVLAFLACHPSW